MTEDSSGFDQRGARRPDVKPFVRNLDVEDTKHKPHSSSERTTNLYSDQGGGSIYTGPS